MFGLGSNMWVLFVWRSQSYCCVANYGRQRQQMRVKGGHGFDASGDRRVAQPPSSLRDCLGVTRFYLAIGHGGIPDAPMKDEGKAGAPLGWGHLLLGRQGEGTPTSRPKNITAVIIPLQSFSLSRRVEFSQRLTGQSYCLMF